MSSESESSSEKSPLATKLAWIAIVGPIVAAIVTAAATLGGAQIQAGATKPSQSVTPNLAVSTNDQKPQQESSDENSPPSSLPSESETAPREAPITQGSLTTMVRDLTIIDGYDWEIVTGDVDGKSYPDSLSHSHCTGGYNGATYVIGKKYKRFKSLIGVDDYSKKDYAITFWVTGDGKTLYSRTLTIGSPALIDVPVSNVIRLKLSFQVDASTCAAYPIWANTRLEK